jgi:holo-[acyl-carrier protein] synthase
VIYGIGTDIVLIARIRTLVDRWGERFPRRVLGPDELREYLRRHGRGTPGPERAVRYLAKRFAAKEAFSKAIGLGLRGPMTLLSLQVLNDARGKPVAVPRKALEPWLRERGLVAHVSISDEVDSALAFVVVERLERPASPGARDAD